MMALLVRRASGLLALDAWKVPRINEQYLSAVIVESRCDPALPLVIANMHARLPTVPVQVFYSRANRGFVDDLGGLLTKVFGEKDPQKVWSWLSLTPLPGLFFEGMNSPGEYSQLLKTVDFWDQIRTEHVLIFQTDSWICRKAEEKLSHFLEYDYVGAPWNHKVEGCEGVGNGGLSLRTRAVMREAASNRDLDIPPRPEDVFFCDEILSRHLGQVAPKGKALSFSDEEIMDGLRDPFGIHKPWRPNALPAEWPLLAPHCSGVHLLRSVQNEKKTCTQLSRTTAEHILAEYKELAVSSLNISRRTAGHFLDM